MSGITPLIKTMFDVIVDQFALGIANRTLDGMELLRQINARTSFLEHGEHRDEMTLSPF
jgi:hypothetical protein